MFVTHFIYTPQMGRGLGWGDDRDWCGSQCLDECSVRNATNIDFSQPLSILASILILTLRISSDTLPASITIKPLTCDRATHLSRFSTVQERERQKYLMKRKVFLVFVAASPSRQKNKNNLNHKYQH